MGGWIDGSMLLGFALSAMQVREHSLRCWRKDLPGFVEADGRGRGGMG